MNRMMIATLMSLMVAGSAFAQDQAPAQNKVDVVFCVDRSGSMDRVIETAKRKIWTIVNEVAQQKPTPILRIGLIGYASAVALMGLSHRYDLLLLLGVMGGMFGSLLHPTANALVPALFPINPGMPIGTEFQKATR